MSINVEIKVVRFGQVKLEISRPIASVEEPLASPVQEAVRYREPQETASRIYEIRYGDKLKNYIIPFSTA